MAEQKIWDVAVIGGGIVGLSVALELQMRGREVLVLDRTQPRARASFGNAGAINRCSVLTIASPGIWKNAHRYATNLDPALHIRWQSMPYFSPWLRRFLASCNAEAWRAAATALAPLTTAAYAHHERLAQHVGATGLIKREGYLKLYRNDAAFAGSALEQDILREVGVVSEALDASALRDLEPSLNPIFTRALFFPESGSADSPGDLVEAYATAFTSRGGVTRTCDVRRLQPRADQLEINCGGDTVLAKNAVVCAGAESGSLLAPLGYAVPLAAERGYHAHFHLKPGAKLGRPMHDVVGGYAAAPMKGGVRVLTGIELARPGDPPNHRQLQAITPRAHEALPLAERTADEVWMGSRPSIADGLPVIGRSSVVANLYFAFGHGHIGFSTGPVTGRIVADLLSNATPPIAVEAYAIERFGPFRLKLSA